MSYRAPTNAATSAQVESLLSNALGVEVQDFYKYYDGFSFTVPTELSAYKAAHKYQGPKLRTAIRPTLAGRWTVQVYNQEDVK